MAKKIEWKTERRKVADLIGADYNPRRLTVEQKKDLGDSIDEFGAVVPIIVNIGSRKDIIIGGHQRVGLYMERGIEEVDVMVPSVELTVEEEMRLNLRLNKNTGEWDEKKLKEMSTDLLLEVGFKDEELSNMWDGTETKADKFKAKEAIEKARTTKIKLGDMFQLGAHRLLCGDSRKPEDVARLMGDVKAEMIYCDPPYNIGLDYSKGVGNQEKYQGAYSSKDDSKTDGAYGEFIEDTMRNAVHHSADDAHFFYWCDERYIWLMQTLFAKFPITNKRVCLWVKNNASPTPQVAFNKAYEPVVYGVKGRPFLNKNYRNFNEILNKETGTGNALAEDIQDIFNLWLVDRDNTQDYDHPTQKPITLHEKPLKRCTAPGHAVLDLFGGSGSTLMACEQLKRRAYMVEYDPVFAQVILDRWEAYTGQKAIKI